MGNWASRRKTADEEQRESSEENHEEAGKGGACQEASSDEPLVSDGQERQNNAIPASGSPSGDDGKCTSSRELSAEHAQEREEMRLSLMLCCADSAETKTLKFPAGLATNIKDLKKVIQSELSIPAPCQKIYFESALLLDQDSLRYCRIRCGDTLHIRYNSVADVNEILPAVDVISDMLTFLQSIQPALASHKNYRHELDNQIQAAINHQTLLNLATSCFNISLGERYKANVVLFTTSGGIELLSQLYKLTQKYQWQYTPVPLQLLESAFLSLLWKISATAPTRVVFLKYPLSDYVIQSALRGTVRPNKRVHAPTHKLSIAPQFAQDALLCKVIGKALGTLCNLAEIPELRLTIASNHKLMQQFTSVLLSPSFSYHNQLMTVAGLIGLAYELKTHCHLAHEDILKNVMFACDSSPHPFSTLLLRYFSALFFSLVLTTAIPHIPADCLHKMHDFLQKFLKNASPQILGAEEKVYHFSWSTILPHIVIVYNPSIPRYTKIPSSAGDNITSTLHQYSIEVGVLSLQTMMLDSQPRRVLVEQGLVEYIQCMPWHLPKGTSAHTRACQLTALLKDLLQNPPSLLKISQTKLATECFGLDYVLNKTPHQLLDVT